MARSKIDNRRDIMLLLLYSPGVTDELNEPIAGRTRLVKMLFLFREEALKHFREGTEITDENFYEFFAWHFGPFSREVYDDLTFFVLRGFIDPQETTEDTLPESAAEWGMWLTASGSDIGDEPLDYEEEAFRLTDRGSRFAGGLYDELDGNQRRLLKQFKKRLCAAPLRALLRYVYENYPKHIDKSQIRGQVLGTG